ncbi:YggS family pyridoxal phosphate-dependent enzyme [Pseudoalteromonas sp. BDTF-M6]|uniref:YggS family pyridoxal phosphate-dependent enzyme n=1 Tax=Pseudoalteromonas sp. BDTF-M6 TaxID=2796132 RepID=UPI001BAEC2FE|nr:YggS family pyridoxal phosphate-dependent enzyme [Pseudoalteromonas sp. BDTF-M6]MBS3798241.1 YggS family pyridoxal phosphate-dependent enzyme [Pseudoalteromonas sp. BDTF-M6]
MVTIAERLDAAYDRIAQAAKKSGRDYNDVTLIAVSKKKPLEDILAAFAHGHREFAESYVQEGVEKVRQLSEHKNIVWHFIGPIQSNKSKAIAEHFSWVQSIDREKIARRLDEQRPSNMKPLQVLIQVNIDDDPNKSGCRLEDVPALAAFIDSCNQLNLRGLMAIPAKSESYEAQLQSFKQLSACFDRLKDQYPQLDTLSMGMSGDMDAAIAAGSTMVRIGTAIFGERDQ